MLSSKNKEIAQEVLISLVARDKLDQVKQYLKETKDIKKEELVAIIEENEEMIGE